MNLLSNAIDAIETQSSPRVITIRTETRQEARGKRQKALENLSPDFVVIQIADNGSGISEEVLHKIFDPFFTTKPVGSGTGLGLSISHQIVVEKHAGQLSCVSAPGQGTKMIVKIPVRVAARGCLAGTMTTEMAIAWGD
jgi:signal transduction histidine kinase